MNDDLALLRHEFDAGDGSFLVRIRVDLDWDMPTFTRLVGVMQRCCEQYGRSEVMERWMAAGFWLVPHFVRDWTTHPDFPRPHAPEYYEAAYRRLDDLAYWFFQGDSPYLAGTGFEPM